MTHAEIFTEKARFTVSAAVASWLALRGFVTEDRRHCG